ncbi:hypothetical protein DK842_06270 [Chromobacterium phragmitis]|uniref:DUF2970 domain-containing protein n=1 Tax=Chromobacterium phragmitis TaxID=2202141 RepID=A0A344UI21_9NEIS|nr:DUF2970 domain-containing protein [Chromobacterium phragmitis]AXE29541.1 hypothetical protein DK842_06270 [Chromobacterium phragmitis]AXE34919.1 hypothetical protein DK843_11790 [Chromobacterium phragmitis]
MSWGQGMKAVLGAFIGVRRGTASQADQALKPWQLIVTALALAGGLIVALLLLVSWVTR